MLLCFYPLIQLTKFYKYLEEHLEDVWLGSRQEDEGKEGGESSVEHGGANLCQRIPDPLVSRALVGQEGVGDVGGVVHTQPDGDDDVGAGHRVYGQAPEVDEAPHIDQGQHHAAQHQQRGGQVEQQHPGGGEHTHRGQQDVTVKLLRDNLQRNWVLE